MIEKKTDRKNKTGLNINYPNDFSNYFTVDDLLKTNLDFPASISLRVKLYKDIKLGKVAELGTLNKGMGRPIKILALTPVKKEVIIKAKNDGVLLEDSTKLIKIMDIKKQAPIITHDIYALPVDKKELVKNI